MPTPQINAPIGVFDSGVGGLTVMRAIVDRLPHESVLYFGDTARVPYGNKSPETICRYSINIADRLVEAGIKALVIACNTASAFAVEALQEHCPVPVLGVIEPVAAEAARRSKSRSVGVIGTRGTVKSGAYPRTLHAIDPDLSVFTHACPLFVPLAEEGWLKGAVPREIAQAYLAAFADRPLDTLILGCTHYPLLRGVIQDVIEEVAGHPIDVLDSASATSKRLEALLVSEGLMAPPSGSIPVHRCLVTDSVEAFESVARRFFGAPLAHIDHIDL